NLTDVNDVAPVVTANQSFTVPENTADGTAVGTVQATDGDATPTTFSDWQITRGNTGGAFAIDASTGQLPVADSSRLNAQAAASFPLPATVAAGVHSSPAQPPTVNLADVNDVAPVVTANQSFTIPENTARGTAVGNLVATDGDVTPTTFSDWQ